MKDRVNAYDVAKLANVSQSTVSRVLNNYPHVRQQTRDKVHKAIEELGFSPDEIARSLASKRSNTIGLIVEDLSNPFYAETAHIILKEAYELNYEVIILDAISDVDSFNRAFNTLVGKRVDGIIISSVHRNNKLIKGHKNSPIIFYNRVIENNKDQNYIVIDNKLGAKIAIDHLVELGHEKIAYISGPRIFSTFNDRYNGFYEAVETHKLDVNEEFIFDGQIKHEVVLKFILDLLSRDEKPTAFFASTDQLALIVMEAISKADKDLPDDISVIGFDDINISSNPFINLTTISQQKEIMASKALHSMIEIINNKSNEKKQEILQPYLVNRGTTGINRNRGSDSY